MIRGLAVETSGRNGSVALVEDGRTICAREFARGLQHAAMMIPLIDELCREAGWKPADLQELYVSAGPGSFTGLRIGITMAKTMAFSTGVKLVAVPSVRVLAENAPAEAQRVVIVLDAKREQIFTAAYQRSGDRWDELEPAHLDSLASVLGRIDRPVHLLGEGIPFHQKYLPAEPEVIVTDPASWRARAEVVGKLGWQMAQRGEFADPMTLAPIYIRVPEAEEKFGMNSMKK